MDSFKEFCDVFSWSYEEILGIDPSIFKHEIRTYIDSKLVRQKLRLVNPCKAAVVKAEVEKLLKVGFIYPIALTEWVIQEDIGGHPPIPLGPPPLFLFVFQFP